MLREERQKSDGYDGFTLAAGNRRKQVTDSKHTAERDTFVLDVMSKIINVSHAVIQLKPAPRSSDQVRLPGWVENVEPLKQDAKFWYTPNYLLLW